MRTPISIVVRSFNSARTLDQALSLLPRRQGDELILVDSGSSDGTLEIGRRHGALILHTDPPFNYSRSLNEGFTAASHEWVLVISSHCIALDSQLLDTMRAFAAAAPDDVVLAYGQIVLREPTRRSDEILYGGIAEWKAGKIGHGGNALALYRRSTWKQNSFDESLVTAEDMAWFLWAIGKGMRFAKICGAMALYRNQGSVIHMFKKGWFESQMAYNLLGGESAGRRKMGRLRAFAINVLSLSKHFLMRRMPLGTYLRQLAHACGACLGTALRGEGGSL